MSLIMLKSIFQVDAKAKAEDYIDSSPQGMGDSRIVKIGGTQLDNPILNSTLSPSPLFITEEFPRIKKYNLQKYGSNVYMGSVFDPDTIPENFSPENNISSKGWQELYKSNHKPKDIDNPDPNNPFQPYIYGGNVNRDNLNIRNNNAKTSLFTWSRTPYLGLGAGEPYIVSSMPTSDGDMFTGRLTNMGSRSIPIVRATTDTFRLTKYLTSPAGIAFIAKQNLLGVNTKVKFVDPDDGKMKQSTQRFGKLYNPLSTLAAISPLARNLGQSVPNVLVRRDEPNIFELFTKTSYDEVVVDNALEDSFMGPSTVDGATTFGGLGAAAYEKISNAISGISGTPTDVKGKEKSSGGDFMTLMDYGSKDKEASEIAKRTIYKNTLEDAHPSDSKNIEASKNGMPFYFKDLRDNAWVFFRAYLEGISENIAPSWSSHNYVGRSEPVYTYESAERDISFTLKLFAHTAEELAKIYEKMNRLTSMCYPEYAEDIYLGNQKMKMKPPIVKFRLGELFGKSKNELIGFLKSVSYDFPAEATWETEQGKRVPKLIGVSIGFQVMHATTPSLDTEFYGYIGG